MEYMDNIATPMKGSAGDRTGDLSSFLISPGGGIGRRVGLKHQCLQGRAGSIPALGTF